MTGAAVQGADWAPLILAVAPNGARKTKRDHPALPITPDELARCAADCRKAGAAMIHLHVRDDAEKHSLSVARYRAATAAIKEAVGDDLIIQATSEAVGIYGPEQQRAMVRELQPEAVSLALKELLPPESDRRAEKEFADFAHWLADTGILPQWIFYSAEELARFGALRSRGLIPPGAAFLLFVLGRYSAGQRSDPWDLLPFLTEDPRDPWAICAFGPRETAVALTASALGGHVRIGFENNLHLPNGEVAPDNAALVAATAAAAEALGRPLADAARARELLSGRSK